MSTKTEGGDLFVHVHSLKICLNENPTCSFSWNIANSFFMLFLLIISVFIACITTCELYGSFLYFSMITGCSRPNDFLNNKKSEKVPILAHHIQYWDSYTVLKFEKWSKKGYFPKILCGSFFDQFQRSKKKLFCYFVKCYKKYLWNKNNAMKFVHKEKRESKYFRFFGYLSTFVVSRVL